MVPTLMVQPEIRLGSASGSITLVTICQAEAPMDWAASITPWSTSRREDSTIRATNGKAAITMGGMVAMVPTLVPTMILDRGRVMIMRIRKGTLRSRLITTFSTAIKGLGRGLMPSFSPVTSSTPRGRPMR